MSIFIRRSLAVFAACVMFLAVASPAAAGARSQSTQANSPVVFDVLILRPIGFVTLVLGTGLFAVGAPIALLTRPGQVGVAADHLVVRPAKYLWKDDLGGH